MVPARSETSKSAKSVFFEDVNDIDIFIEDTAIGFEKIYAILFSRVFSDAYSVEKVFPCLLYTSPSPRDRQKSRMPSSA